jgi:NADH:ubiquinone oxidoreductase subunit E
MGTACHVKGAARVLDSFSRELGVASGDTTADEKFTLEAVACLGCCSIAPVVRIDDEIIGDFQPRDVEKTLTRFRKAGNAGN